MNGREMARLLHPQKLPRHSIVAASVKGHFLPHAPATKAASYFADHHKWKFDRRGRAACA
jgi:hypothetical protein